MYSLGILLASIAASAIAGAFITYWFQSTSATKKQALKAEDELKETQEAFEAYRNEVLGEFSETASKFKALNTSYIELHQQLSRSANTLCGEAAANVLLEAPLVEGTISEEPKHTAALENTEVENVEVPVEVEVEFEPDTVSVEDAAETNSREDISAHSFVKH